MCFWWCFTSDDKESSEERKKRQLAKWAKEKQENTLWTISELQAFYSEGKRHGLLSVKSVYDKESVAKAMRDIGINVVFRFECRPCDIDGIHDKTYFIINDIVPTKELLTQNQFAAGLVGE
jgi:hypothetical protein